MKQTVVGVFDQYAAAKHAADLLRQQGIDDDDIHVTAADDDYGGTVREDGDGHREMGLMERIREFFMGTLDDDDRDEMGAYSEALRRGGAVVKVEVDEEPQIDAAREALEQAGAVDIDERVDEWKASGWAPSDSDSDIDSGRSTATMPRAGMSSSSSMAATPSGSALDTGMRSGTASSASDSATSAERSRTARSERLSDQGEQVIPVVKEEVQVGKRAVKAGGVRIYSRLVEDRVNESVELREERARVERRPADRAASDADLDALRDRSIEIEETVERPVVQKTARVVEEVVVGKDVRQKTAKIDEKVRHTEVKVDKLGGDERQRLYDDYDRDFRSDYSTRFAKSGKPYEQYEPAYRFGHSLATDPRYQGRSWEQVEADARTDWGRSHDESTWQEIKDAVRHAWDRVTS
jgi:uncharacterized protein (TIGR02271 family)